MKKLGVKVAIIIVVCLILLMVAAAFFLGSIVKKGVEKVGPQITKTEMKLDGATLSLLSGSGTLKGFLLGNPEGYKTESAVKVGTVDLGIKPASIFSDKIHVTRVNVQGPEITFEGTLGTKNNLSQILENVQGTANSTGRKGTERPPDTKEKGPSRKMQVDDFVISEAKVHLSMSMLGGKSATLTLPEIHLKDIGKDSDGVTAAALAEKVLSELTVAVIAAVEKSAGDLSKGATDAAREATKGATQQLDKATKSIGDLFKKK